MNFSDFKRKTLVTVDEETSTARIESYNLRLLATLRRTSGREGVICLADFPSFGVYTVPKEMVSAIARETYEDMLRTPFADSRKQKIYRKRIRKYGGKKWRR